MAHLIIGGAVAAGLLCLTSYAQDRGLGIKWWQWLLILIEFAFGAFALEVLVSFLEEGTLKGALVMGTILGFVALAAAFLTFRLILRPRTN
jgi:uncharacterized membrane-anchored protein